MAQISKSLEGKSPCLLSMSRRGCNRKDLCKKRGRVHIWRGVIPDEIKAWIKSKFDGVE